MLTLMLRIRDFLTGGGYPSAKNPDNAKGDASFKDDSNSQNVDTSKNDVNSNDVNSNDVNIHKNDAVNSNVKDDNATNDSADVKKSKVAVYKSVQAVKEVSKDKKDKENKGVTGSVSENRAAKDDKAAADSTNNDDKKSEVKPNKEGIYDFSNDKNVTNPFPNVITPAEVKDLQDKTKSVRPLSSIQKIFYTAYGKKFSVENGQASGDTKSIDEFINAYSGRLGRIDIFIFLPRVDKESVYTGDGQFYSYRSSRELKNPDGSVNFDLNKAPDGKIPYKLEVNGKLVGSNLADKTNIKVYMRKNQTFIHVVMEGSNANEAILGYEGFNHEDSSGVFGYFAFIPECGAQFHFVDDLQYRKVANIEGNGELSQRSSGETDRFSTKPFTKLDLSDLSEIKNIAGVRFGNNQVVRNMYTPLLSYEGDPKKDSIKRPTMEELKNTKIPGYLYYSNDIDTPKGGEFTADNTGDFGNYDYGIVRDKDDNQVTTKHYYVTFRPIPTQLVVQYKDLKSNIERDKPFELYVGEKKDGKKVNHDFKSSVAGKSPDLKDLKTMIMNKNTSLLPEAAGYFSGKNIYLAPGNYTVNPTAEAPDDYEWVVASTDIANSSTSANVNIAVHEKDTDPTQQVVTFVLRRKIATVTFFDGDDSKPYATVTVQKGSSIDGDELKNQSMPKYPTKPGFTFNGWFTGKDGKGTKFTGNTTVSSSISVYSSYTSKPPTPPTPEPTPVPEPEPEPKPEPKPEPTPSPEIVPDLFVPVESKPEPKSNPQLVSVPAPDQTDQPEQPKQQKHPEAKHAAKNLPQTGSTTTTVLASAIAALFAGIAGFAESFAANRNRKN